MAIPNIFNTGRSGMTAARTQLATTGHNISNANTEGYSRQRVEQAAGAPSVGRANLGPNIIGNGTTITRVERVNDQYLDKQIRNASRDLSAFEEKDVMLRQTEDIFNEMGGEGLNRLMTRFFNDFRKLSMDPDNAALRESVRESANSMVSDIHRIRKEVEDVRRHIDSRLDGHVREVNALTKELAETNIRISALEVGGTVPNDLLDKREQLLKKLGSYFELSMHQDNQGAYLVDIAGVGPLISGGITQPFSTRHSPKNGDGKPDAALDLVLENHANSVVTDRLRGGKIGAGIEVRDQLLDRVLARLDEMAFSLGNAVNAIHRNGFTRTGVTGVNFFKPILQKERASEFINLSDEVQSDGNMIAAAAEPDSPGDNRIAVAISAIQGSRLMGDGTTTIDDWYNSIVSDVGVMSGRNRSSMAQQTDIMNQLAKFREQTSGVSIDEETANLMQFHHAFEASAKVIQVADEMLKTVLELKR